MLQVALLGFAIFGLVIEVFCPLPVLWGVTCLAGFGFPAALWGSWRSIAEMKNVVMGFGVCASLLTLTMWVAAAVTDSMNVISLVKGWF